MCSVLCVLRMTPSDENVTRREPARASIDMCSRSRRLRWVILCRPFDSLTGGSLRAALDQFVLVGVRRCRRSRGEIELDEDVADVPGHGFLADRQLGGDRTIRSAGRNQAEDFDF